MLAGGRGAGVRWAGGLRVGGGGLGGPGRRLAQATIRRVMSGDDEDRYDDRCCDDDAGARGDNGRAQRTTGDDGMRMMMVTRWLMSTRMTTMTR